MSDRPHLLLVDDERSIREPLAQYLVRNGFRVTAVENAAEARLRLNANAIDLVILDIMMPGEDGLSLCRHIRETSEIPVILLTAWKWARTIMCSNPFPRANWSPASR